MNFTIISALPMEVKFGVLCITVVLAPNAVILILVIETVVLEVAEVDELALDRVSLDAVVTVVDGVEVEVVVTLVDDLPGEAEVVEVLVPEVFLASKWLCLLLD